MDVCDGSSSFVAFVVKPYAIWSPITADYWLAEHKIR